MAKHPDVRFNEELRKLVDGEVTRRVADLTYKLKKQAQGARSDRDRAIKAADNRGRQLKEAQEKIEALEEHRVAWDKELARARVTIRGLQDQALKQEVR